MTVMIGVNDVARMLDMSPSTVKKYYLEVEKHGKRFFRNQKGHVMFDENDIVMFKNIIILKNKPDMDFHKACAKVAASITDITVYQPPEDSDEPIDTTVMANEIKALKEMIIQMKHEMTELRLEQKESRLMIESKNEEEKNERTNWRAEIHDYRAEIHKTNQLMEEVLKEMASSRDKTFFEWLFGKKKKS